MKKILLSISLLAAFSSLIAQTVSDSVMMKAGYTTDIFYSMKNGFVDSSNNSTWQLAFATRPSLFPNNTLQSTSIRINEARGVNVFKSNFTNSQWNSFDSAGFKNWISLHDNDSSWDLSAFNYGLNVAQFNYGWGSYDQTSHDVIGTNVYLIKIKNGTTFNYRKFMIQRLVYDSQWVFTFANLDGTDSNTVRITKSSYANKLFAYYNLTNKTQFNREPNANLWDMVFTYFNTPVLLGPPPAVQYNVAGVLTNPRSPSARIMHIDKNAVTPASVTLLNQANNISWDWSNPPMGPPPADYSLIDSMAFFVLCQADNRPYRLYFTKYTTTDPGKFIFNKKSFQGTGISDLKSNTKTFEVYPNPTSSIINMVMKGNVKNATINIFDITGKNISTSSFINQSETSIDVSNFNKGIYFITLDADGIKTSKKFIVE
ncbi:MAG: T9SS type A sorting domain-containing protein [Bacteroidota bacterium]